MAEFKVGDKVRCIDDSDNNNYITTDKIYTVIEDRGDYINIKDNNDYSNSFYIWRFEKVKEDNEYYEVSRSFTLHDIWVAFKDNHGCKEFQKAWGDLLLDFHKVNNIRWYVHSFFTSYDKDCVPETLWKYRDKLEEKGFIKKVKKDINLKPGMKLKNTYNRLIYRIIRCDGSSFDMTHFNILIEENNSCYDFGKIFSCNTLEELNQLTGEEFEVINEK